MGNSFGEFLKRKRLENNLTQKELAKSLFVSESAVSKWEKDVAHPDITLLPKLSNILGVSEHELITASIDKKTREEKKQAKKWRVVAMSWSLFFYISYALTILTCFICNLAVDGTLSWFWIVLSSLLLAFTFTNLPKLIKEHRIFLLPLSSFLSLCLLLGVCCLYTKGDWFWIATLSVLLVLVMIFIPIYIAKFKIFNKIKKYNDFISVGIDFVMLNILLIVINVYCIVNAYTPNDYWYFKTALPITVVAYLFLNLLLCVKFLKTNKYIRTSIILTLINMFVYITPLFINVKTASLQEEIDSLNIFKSNFSNWKPDAFLENNIHCIISLTLLFLAIIFAVVGFIRHLNKSKNN